MGMARESRKKRMQLEHMKIKSNMVIASFSAVGDVFFCSEVEIGMIPENPIAKVKKNHCEKFFRGTTALP